MTTSYARLGAIRSIVVLAARESKFFVQYFRDYDLRG
jgi:hypothetical protein